MQNDLWKRALEAQEGIGAPLTQVGVADSAGVKQPSVQRWASGEGLPTMRQAITFCLTTGVTPDWFLLGRGSKYPAVSPGSREELVLQILHAGSDERKAEILSYARFLEQRAKDS